MRRSCGAQRGTPSGIMSPRARPPICRDPDEAAAEGRVRRRPATLNPARISALSATGRRAR